MSAGRLRREEVRRRIFGEADNDLYRLADLSGLVHGLRVNPVKSLEYQRALGDVMRGILKLPRIEGGR